MEKFGEFTEEESEGTALDTDAISTLFPNEEPVKETSNTLKAEKTDTQ